MAGTMPKGDPADENTVKSIGNNCAAGTRERIGENILSVPGSSN